MLTIYFQNELQQLKGHIIKKKTQQKKIEVRKHWFRIKYLAKVALKSYQYLNCELIGVKPQLVCMCFIEQIEFKRIIQQ